MTGANGEWVVYSNVMQLLRRRHDPVMALQEIHRSAGDYVRCRLLGSDVYLVSHPDAVSYVLQSNQQNYVVGEPKWSPLVRTLGTALLCADGQRYLRQRRLVQPAFQAEQIVGYASTVLEIARRVRHDWEARAEPLIDMHQEMLRLTMVVIGKVLFSVDLSAEARQLGRLMTEVLELAVGAYLSPLGRFTWLPTPANRRLARLTREFDKTIYRMIEERRASNAPQRDLLWMLLQAHDDETLSGSSRHGLDDREIRDLATVLFAAGHETTANMLTWTWYLLARNPEAQARLHAELDDVLGGRDPQLEDLPNLKYTEKVLCEALRLYPPSWIHKRRTVEPDCIEGHNVPAGALVYLSSYVVHRDARWFPDPESFDPERFEGEIQTDRPCFSYFPFGGGVRRCIGQPLAETQGRLIIATLGQHFTPRVVGNDPAMPSAAFLRPKGGLTMRLVRRPARNSMVSRPVAARHRPHKEECQS